jgi:hypothetical protein
MRVRDQDYIDVVRPQPFVGQPRPDVTDEPGVAGVYQDAVGSCNQVRIAIVYLKIVPEKGLQAGKNFH